MGESLQKNWVTTSLSEEVYVRVDVKNIEKRENIFFTPFLMKKEEKVFFSNIQNF